MEAQYGKFLDVIRAVRINVPLVNVLARMPNYEKFLKELISDKHKIKQMYAAFLSDECSTMIQNKVPSKLGDPGSFLIPCNFNKTFSYNALADLGASINLMPYSLYAKLSLETLKPTEMSVRLADRSFQYPVGIAKNMLVEFGKFTFPADFVILKIEEDNKVPLILGRPFLYTADAVIQANEAILHSIKGTLLEEEIFSEFDEFIAMTADENSKSESDTKELPFKKITINTDYKIKTSLKEPPTDLELKPLPNNLEYVFLEEPSFLPVIISSQLFPRCEVDDNFLGETLMEINTKDEPWFADFANYLVADIIPKGMTYQQKNKFFSDLKHYVWEEPYLFKVCSDGMIRHCVSGPETRTILDQCHHGPTDGHYRPNVTAKKVLDSGFYWLTIIKEAHALV
ncbi:reverse transcriptase domain-containing protein [Tanacetum coccineum]